MFAEISTREHLLTINNHPIFAREYFPLGMTPTLTLLFQHYWGGSHRTWEPVITHLLQSSPTQSIRCIAYDDRGWSNSRLPPTVHEKPFDLPNLAKDAKAIIKHFKLNPYILIGHSRNSKIAALLFGTESDIDIPLPEGVVFVAPSPFIPMPIPDEQRLGMLHAYTTRESTLFTVSNILTSSTLPPHLLDQVLEDSSRGSDEAIAMWPLRGTILDASEAAGRFSQRMKDGNVPILVVAGELDKVEPVELVKREVVGKVEGAEVVVVEGVGHLVPLEGSEKLADIVKDFVGKL
ncbi:hypothetical protein HDV00_008635 [Rhizophlyctis rosea]|nr:hypothetical protein HDV00_008635 [Rhizophlyctis rosea]